MNATGNLADVPVVVVVVGPTEHEGTRVDALNGGTKGIFERR